MSNVDFVKAKADIAEIVAIVRTVPEALQQRCFELHFDVAFGDVAPMPGKPEAEDAKGKMQSEKEKLRDPPPTEKKLPSNVLVFARRHNITRDELGKLFMLAHDPLLPVYKIPDGNIAKAQLSKVMMVLLENGLLNNTLNAPYTELRESAKDDGLHDSNFNKVLKRNHELFRGAISADGINEDGVVELTGSGMEKLAEVIRELGQ